MREVVGSEDVAGSEEEEEAVVVVTTVMVKIKATTKEEEAEVVETSMVTKTETKTTMTLHSPGLVDKTTRIPKTRQSSSRTRKSMSTWMTLCLALSLKKEINNNSDCTKRQHRSHLKTSSEKISQNFKKYSKLVNDLL